jgi:hypothetical protein
MKTLEIRVELTDAQAWDLAQFFQRVGFADYRNNASSDDEACAIRNTGEQVRRALGECGYVPR